MASDFGECRTLMTAGVAIPNTDTSAVSSAKTVLETENQLRQS